MLHVCLAPHVGSANAPQAGHLFLHQHLQATSRSYHSVLVAPDTDENREQAAVEGRAYDVRIVPPRSRPRGAWRLQGVQQRLGDSNWATRRPALHKDTLELLASADVIELQWTQTLTYVRHLRRVNPTAVISAFEHDVNFARLETPDAGDAGWLRPVVLAARRRLEIAAVNRTDVTCVFKLEDVARLNEGDRSGTKFVVHGPWLERYQIQSPVETPTVLFVGAFRRPENYEAIDWFADRVWPSVQAAVPDARLIAAGSGMDPSRAARLELLGVEVTGFVEDLGPVYARARVVVAPLLKGEGLKFKVAQGMLAGLPVVGTSVAYSGYNLPEALEVLRHDDASNMAGALSRLLLDSDHARSLGQASAAFAQTSFSFDKSHAQLMATWAACRQERARTGPIR